jgi:hypothetical protein
VGVRVRLRGAGDRVAVGDGGATGSSAAPRKAPPAGAVAKTATVRADGTSRYSRVGDAVYSAHTRPSMRPVSEYTASLTARPPPPDVDSAHARLSAL